ncbi:phytanoyl-CoA dioxygenase PhyH [Paraburkholderia sp. BL6669N2]|uniref:phytanoyl-CoA dioxygenase family protein n=1 Tax=Paraburkholderia sp. BL6669N2 TaxID=1938807 RepID=UPI000E2217D8|nr:phytanoyl-CoA dioxygenase family protein [Paraburkholderia sp. BL6669N2]REG50890.1 phytanoyl-CoA dioxygenase PhyH [Paraburkholderia sp. BL6669N2]
MQRHRPNITEEDVAFYRAHGWWVSDVILPDELLDDLAYAIDRYAAGERDRPLPQPLLPQWAGAPERGLRQADYLSLQLDSVMDFVRTPLLPLLASTLSGTDEIRLFHDQLIWKDPDGQTTRSTVGWHTDRAYWKTCTSEKMLTAWVPLQDTSEEMGTLAVWDASHLWSGTDDLHTFNEPELDIIESRVRASNHTPNIMLLPLRRGQVSFHHCRLVHGSYPNRTGRPRIAFAIHYQDGENRHIAPRASEKSPVHLNDMLCRSCPDGTPDYADPEVCPVLFSTSRQA